MEGKFIRFLSCALILYVTVLPVHGYYYSKSAPRSTKKEQMTKLHFFFHDTIAGRNPSATRVAGSSFTSGPNPVVPFGSVFAIHDILTVGPDPTSEVIGNAQGLYVSSGPDVMSLVVYIDYGFTKDMLNGSSISVFSRDPITQGERELAVVGGRGKFRMARGFAQLKTYFFNTTNGDAIVEYDVTVFHY